VGDDTCGREGANVAQKRIHIKLVYYNSKDTDRDKSIFSEDENLIGCMGCSGRGIRGLDFVTKYCIVINPRGATDNSQGTPP
jgi:hypothetical protein